MALVKWVSFGLLALPLLEIAVLALLAAVIGWIGAIALFLGTSLIGILLLRQNGLENLVRLRGAVELEGIRALNLDTPGIAPLLAGILLTIPGFITDIFGAALLLAPFRQWLRARLARLRKERRARAEGPSVIELEPGQYHQVSELPPNDKGKRREPG